MINHEPVAFRRLKSPTTEELAQLIHTISGRIGRYLERAGLLIRDIETCVHCDGAVKVIACIEDPAVIKQIRGHIAKHEPPPKVLPPHVARAPPDTGYPG